MQQLTDRFLATSLLEAVRIGGISKAEALSVRDTLLSAARSLSSPTANRLQEKRSAVLLACVEALETALED